MFCAHDCAFSGDTPIMLVFERFVLTIVLSPVLVFVLMIVLSPVLCFCAHDCAFSGAVFCAHDCAFSGAICLCS